MQKWPYVESAPENIIPDNFHDKCSNRLCLKNSPCSVLRELCDDPVAAEEEGEEGAGQDAGHRGRHQAQRQPHALLNRLRLTDLRYFPTTAEYHFSFLYCTVWGGRLRKRFCNMFSESSTGSWAELQVPWCTSKQGELPENMLKNLLLNLPPHTVVIVLIRALSIPIHKESWFWFLG